MALLVISENLYDGSEMNPLDEIILIFWWWCKGGYKYHPLHLFTRVIS